MMPKARSSRPLARLVWRKPRSRRPWPSCAATSFRCRPRCRRSRSTVSAHTGGYVLVSQWSCRHGRSPYADSTLLGLRELEVDGVACVDLTVVVECSSGTYVRALARDLGAALGVGGHLTTLRRTRVGTFTLDEAQTLEEAERQLRIMPLDRVVRSSFATLDRHRGPGRLHPKRSPVGWCDLARPHDGITRPGRCLPGALPPGRTGCCCRGGLCLSYRLIRVWRCSRRSSITQRKAHFLGPSCASRLGLVGLRVNHDRHDAVIDPRAQRAPLVSVVGHAVVIGYQVEPNLLLGLSPASGPGLGVLVVRTGQPPVGDQPRTRTSVEMSSECPTR